MGRATFLEAKFSAGHDSLRSCFSGSVSAQQLASARLVEPVSYTHLYPTLLVDGDFGPRTASVVREWRSDWMLPASEDIDAAAWAKLRRD